MSNSDNPFRTARHSAAKAWQPGLQDWRAWHVFLHSSDALEQLLTDVVMPVFRDTERSCDAFFIRYWENGPHIRLRVRGIDDQAFAKLGTALSERAQVLAEGLGPAPNRFSSEMRFDGWHSDPATLPWFPAASTIEISYEPETRRYGGRHGLAASEALFGASSMLALAIIEKTPLMPARRQSIALALTTAAIGTVVADVGEARGFLEIMKANWSGFASDPDAASRADRAFEDNRHEIEALAGLLLGKQNPYAGGVAGHWHAACANYVDEIRDLAQDGLLIHPATGIAPSDDGELQLAVQNLMFSQVHMMNNRLGILPQQEFQFANMLLAGLASISV